MFRSIAALAVASASLAPAAAPATSITASRPHDPKLGCKAVKALIRNFNVGRLGDPKASASPPAFYSDALGKVEQGEEAAFLHALRHSEGRRDRGPIRLYRIFTIDGDQHYPVYLVVLERESRRETRIEEDEEVAVREVRDPRFERESSYWLAKFSSNAISHFREAPEMFQLMDEARALKRCYQD